MSLSLSTHGSVKKRRKDLSDMSARHLRRLKKEVSLPMLFTSSSKSTGQFDSSGASDLQSSISPIVGATTSIHVEPSPELLLEHGGEAPDCSETSTDGECIDEDSDIESASHREQNLNSELSELMDKAVDFEVNCVEEPVEPQYSDSESGDEENLSMDLASWAVRRNVNQNALQDLLAILRKHPCHSNLPKDPRTLLKTPKTTPVRDMPPGQFCYIGVARGLTDLLASSDSDNMLTQKQIKLMVNVDGVPIAKSSNSVLWPILGAVKGSSKVFMIACYHGYEKPADSNDFMADFVEEMIQLRRFGLLFNSQQFDVILDALVCDAPAKSFLLNIKGHAGYSGCTKCCEEGEYQRNRMCYHELNSVLRTDESFRSHIDDEFHTGRTILENIPDLGLVSNVPLDYLHLVLLGVMRKLITMWLSGDLKVRFSKYQVDRVSARLCHLSQYIPSEFQRNPNSLKGASSWKGTENRLFLLYTGPVALKGVLPDNLFCNFMALHVAISVLTSVKFHLVHREYADSLLRCFVQSFKTLYGDHLVSHNVHGLIHLAKDVEKYGPLDDFSAFKFENFNQFLKKQKRKSEKPLQQIVRRAAEKSSVITSQGNFTQNVIQFKQPHFDGPLISGTKGPQYKVVSSPNFNLGVSQKNSCCGLEDGSVIIIENIASSVNDDSAVIIGKKMTVLGALYLNPCDSQVLGIMKASNVSQATESWPLTSVVMKYVCLPVNEYFALFPLLHVQ